ncbi:hypothetical protein SOPP22_15900 [Shewanella sp. OPT22]|nr:hypothetical protein SOPP22_15900 [Shewanella sp. OPT22]
MKYICILLTFLLFGCSSNQRVENFDLKIEGVFDSYDYSTSTYNKRLCGDSSDYSSKIELTKLQIEKIRIEAQKINFFGLPDYMAYQNKSVISDDLERIEVCAPCPNRTTYLKLGDRSHSITWSCNCSNFEEPTPKVIKAFIASIDNSISKAKGYKKAPESMCRLR